MSEQIAPVPTIAETFEVLQKLTAHLEAMQSALDLIATRSISHQATLHALIESHPSPRTLFDSFASCMDSIAGLKTTVNNAELRGELHEMQSKILRTINAASLRSKS